MATIIYCEVYIGEGKKGNHYGKQINNADFYLLTCIKVSLRSHEELIELCKIKKMVYKF